ncbi:tripartite tricarboxylate transporter substrate binding protein [Caldimonas sp.]|uniref:Bug family tripartite tricarboxylate transporter substrate binding protein n=1 Tax=Caldimonas sp. TaxID=2838790 RepID=UPI0029D7639F|nr:tripartite tricarboxylate transporter substrate binding protein [Caldimonas manganoxidans]
MGGVQAQSWPAKPITLVVPFSPGGTTDVLARALADRLQGPLGQPVVVENKPGAGATLGAAAVARAPADGYTLLMGAVHHTIATSVYKKLSYSFERDLAPITTVALVPNVWVINAATPAQDVKSMVELIRRTQPAMTYGSNGVGTLQHLIGTQLSEQFGVSLTHVPYKGSGPLTTDLIGGQVHMSFDTITPVLPHIKAGKLRALAVTSAKRSSALPEVPTLDEAAVKGFDMGTWFGVLAPAATPKEVLSRLHREMVAIIRSPEFGQRMRDIGAEPIGDTSEEMAQRIAADTARYAQLVKKARVTLD